MAAIAYRTAEALIDPRDNATHAYENRLGVLYTEIVGWTRNRQQLWAETETLETRKNSRLAVELIAPLDPALSLEQNANFVRGYARWAADFYGIAVDFAIHAPSERGDQRNVHSHIVLGCRRVINGRTLGSRVVPFNGPTEVKKARQVLCAMQNSAYEAAGSDTRVDHRSYADQGIDREPTQHMGPAATAMERRGERTEIGDRNRATEARNREREATRLALQLVAQTGAEMGAAERDLLGWQQIAALAEAATQRRARGVPRARSHANCSRTGALLWPQAPAEPQQPAASRVNATQPFSSESLAAAHAALAARAKQIPDAGLLMAAALGIELSGATPQPDRVAAPAGGEVPTHSSTASLALTEARAPAAGAAAPHRTGAKPAIYSTARTPANPEKSAETGAELKTASRVNATEPFSSGSLIAQAALAKQETQLPILNVTPGPHDAAYHVGPRIRDGEILEGQARAAGTVKDGFRAADRNRLNRPERGHYTPDQIERALLARGVLRFGTDRVTLLMTWPETLAPADSCLGPLYGLTAKLEKLGVNPIGRSKISDFFRFTYAVSDLAKRLALVSRRTATEILDSLGCAVLNSVLRRRTLETAQDDLSGVTLRQQNATSSPHSRVAAPTPLSQNAIRRRLESAAKPVEARLIEIGLEAARARLAAHPRVTAIDSAGTVTLRMYVTLGSPAPSEAERPARLAIIQKASGAFDAHVRQAGMVGRWVDPESDFGTGITVRRAQVRDAVCVLSRMSQAQADGFMAGLSDVTGETGGERHAREKEAKLLARAKSLEVPKALPAGTAQPSQPPMPSQRSASDEMSFPSGSRKTQDDLPAEPAPPRVEPAPDTLSPALEVGRPAKARGRGRRRDRGGMEI